MTDTSFDIECPACGKTMKKVYLPDSNINIDICVDGCGGIYFDNRELEKFDEEHENADIILEELKGKSFLKTDESAVRTCPRCKIPMVKMGSGKGDVEIDVCNVCGAKFLDNSELQKIRESAFGNISKYEDTLNYLFDENLHNVLGSNAGVKPICPQARDFVIKIISNYL